METINNVAMETTNAVEDNNGEYDQTRVQISDTVNTEKEMVSKLTGGGGGGRKVPNGNTTNTGDYVLSNAPPEEEKQKNKSIYKCEHCTETFTTSKVFKTHCKSRHNVTHPYKCDYCDNVYTHISALNVHLRTHDANNRPYSCKICDRSFSQNSSLANHILRHSGATPHNCDVCFKSFVLKGELKTHYRIHLPTKPFHCKDCGLSFPRKSNFTRHMRKHTGEKPYGCKFCSKTFARSGNRDEHQRTHTNERPYACKICDARFSDSGNFSKHKRMHDSNRNSLKRKKPRSCEKVVTTALLKCTETTDKIPREEGKVHRRKTARPRFLRRSKKKDECDNPPEPLTINLTQKPQPTAHNTGAAKPVPQLFVTLPEIIKADHITGFIKLSDTIMDTPPLKDSENSTVNMEIELSTSTNHFNYQYSGLLNTQTNLPVLNYPNSINGHHGCHGYNMMLDYSRDQSFSFHTDDASLILPDSSFTRTHSSNPLTGSDDYIYGGGSMAPNELTDHDTLHDTLFTRNDTVSTSLASSTTNNPFSLDGSPDERQPLLDTSKFLNEQYLMKK